MFVSLYIIIMNQVLCIWYLRPILTMCHLLCIWDFVFVEECIHEEKRKERKETEIRIISLYCSYHTINDINYHAYMYTYTLQKKKKKKKQ